MPRLPSAGLITELLRAGNLPLRLRATREGLAAVRLQLVRAALDLGILDALADGPADTAELARRTGVAETELLAAFLRTVAAAGLVRGGGGWQLTRTGRALVGDDLVRASYQAFGDFHTGLYRDLRPLLGGGPRRRDVADKGELIARVSAAFDPFVHDLLIRTVGERQPQRVLDVGCGAGIQLAAMLEAAPAATGVGVDADGAAAGLAERTLQQRGLADRGSVHCLDIQQALADGPSGALAEPFDFALLANVIYYVPVDERVGLLRSIAALLAPGGALMVITTAATPHLTSRHFDLLLRAQQGRMELPDAEGLAGQLAEAGLQPEPPQGLAPGTPLIAVSAVRPG